MKKSVSVTKETVVEMSVEEIQAAIAKAAGLGNGTNVKFVSNEDGSMIVSGVISPKKREPKSQA